MTIGGGAGDAVPDAGFAPGGLLLAIDTATRHAAVAIGDGVGSPLAHRTWAAGYRHGEELLAVIDEVLEEAASGLRDLRAIVAGTGPGAFTGLRVGLATAKGLAYGLGIPIVGIASTAAIAAAARMDGTGAPAVSVLLPAGPHDRYLARYDTATGVEPVPLGDPELVPGGEPLAPRLAGTSLLAIDLHQGPAVAAEAVAAGGRAQSLIGPALLVLGRHALVTVGPADVAELVPGYVTLPRGIVEQVGAIEWSRDLR
jgi:tRNA threonylcarbamoyl adenosine modification protein YeaZ